MRTFVTSSARLRLVLVGLAGASLVSVASCAKSPEATPSQGVSSAPSGPREKIAGPGNSLGESDKAGMAMSVAPTNSAPSGTDTSFKVEVIAATPASGKVGDVQKVSVRATPGPGYHMNHDFPASLTVTAVDGVTVAKPVQELGDAARLVDAELIFDVQVTATKAGEFALPAKFKFAVCTDSSCDPKSATLSLAVAGQ